MAYTVHGVLYLYGTFVFGGCFAGFAAAGFDAKAKSSVIVGAVSAACAVACARLSTPAGAAPPQKGEPGYKAWMMGVHLGLMLPALLAPVFAWRAYKSSHAWLATLLGGLAAGSLVALAALVRLKPKKKKDNK